MTTVCRFDDLDDGEMRSVDVDGTPVAVVRIGDAVHAIGDRCSHADFLLTDGELDVDECKLECPKHGSAFSLTTGQPLSLPAVRGVPVYEVSVVDGVIEVGDVVGAAGSAS